MPEHRLDGARLVRRVANFHEFAPPEGLRLALPVVLIAIALFFALKPGLTDDDRLARVTPTVFAATVVPLVGALVILGVSTASDAAASGRIARKAIAGASS